MLRKKPFLALIIMFITMAFCLAAWSEPNPQQTITQSKSGKLAAQKTSNQENPTKDIVTFQILVDAISRAIDTSAEKAKATQNPPPPDNSSFWFSLFLVMFTGVLAAVAIFQFFVLRKTLRETQKAANAAKDSADALPILERAYIFSKVIPSRKIEIFHGGFDYDKGLEAELWLKNHGKTPAIIKEIAFWGYKYDSPIRDKLIVIKVHAPRESFIGHDEEFEEDSYGFPFITKDEWVGLCTIPHKLIIYCVGYVKYTTIFGEEHCHFFCWEFDGPTGKFMLSPDSELNYDT